MKHKILSVVVPVFNEALGLPGFHERLWRTLETLPFILEVIYVNDGSTDKTLEVLQTLKQHEPRTAIVDLSRNFGKEIALSAGLDHAQGDVVVVIDADCQDPPELIPALLARWEQGYDVVYAQRTTRLGETWVKKITAHLFYRLIRRLSSVEIPVDTGDFRALSRRAVDALKLCREKNRFMKGLFWWVGFKQTAVLYEREMRLAGETKWNYWKLWNLAIEGITSFTIAPLKVATYLGFTTAFSAFVYALVIIYKTLAHGEPVQGYPSLMVVILFLGGIQLVTLGVIGEYLGRTFDESKQRPLYLLNAFLPAVIEHVGDEIFENVQI